MSRAVDELYGTLKFAREFEQCVLLVCVYQMFCQRDHVLFDDSSSADAVSQTSETLRVYHGKREMPAFGVVENLVEEEVYIL